MKQPPSIVGQKIRFMEDAFMSEHEIVIIGDKKTIALWREYFSVFIK